MKFNPISEEKAAAQSSGLWPDGDYDYSVRSAVEKLSSAGNEMIELELVLYDSSGGQKVVKDYLMADERWAWKIRHFATSCGLLSRYAEGVLEASDMEGRPGKCVVTTQPAKDSWPAKNVIRNYIPAKEATRLIGAEYREPGLTIKRKALADDLDDEIPF